MNSANLSRMNVEIKAKALEAGLSKPHSLSKPPALTA